MIQRLLDSDCQVAQPANVGAWNMDWSRLDRHGKVTKQRRMRSLVKPLLGGSALLDEWVDEGGFSVRSYDERARKWRFFWTDNQNTQGRMQY